MMGGASFLFVLVVIGVVLVAVVAALVLAWKRRGPRAGTVPVCGACGYQLAPNPSGLTVCPECGGDFLSVGILAPNMKLGRRGSPAVPLGIAWFILVGVGMIPLHRQLTSTFTRTLTTSTVTQTSAGRGPFRSVTVNARREQIAGLATPDVLSAAVTVTGNDGKQLAFEVDGLSNSISDTSSATGIKGLKWDRSTAGRVITGVGGGEAPDDESADKLVSIVGDALGKTAGAGPFGGGGIITSSSSSSGFSSFRRSGGYSESSASSNFRSAAIPVVIIGTLRGGHWVTIITISTGLLLVFGGLWGIVRLSRERR